MLATLQALFNALRATATSEARSLSRVLFFLIMSAYTMAAIQAAFGKSQQVMMILGIVIIFLNALQLFRINRLIRLTAIGETLELARVMPTQTGIISNKLISTYWQIAVQLMIIISVFCIATPFMPLWRAWWVPIVWPTLFVFAGVALGALGRRFFRLALTFEILALVFAISSVMFPQISAQFRIGELSQRFLRADIADDVNIIEKTRQSQRDAEIKRDLSEISEWVQKNPNGKYPDDYSRFLESVKNGERKTLNEIRFEILHPEISKPTTKKTGWEKVEEKVVDFSQLEATPIAQGSVVGEIPISMKKLEAGQYRVKLSGGWAFFMSNNAWTEFPWQGNNRLAGRPEFRPEQKMNFGAIILSNNGENITPVDEKGLQVSLSESSNISIRINVLLGVGEFYSTKIGKPVFKNSTVSPLTITIEKEVKN